MPPTRLQNAIGIPRTLVESTAFGCAPIGQKRCLSWSSVNRFNQIAPDVSKNGPGLRSGRSKRCSMLPCFQRRGVGIKSSWEYQRTGTPKRSDAAGNVTGALALLLGAVAVFSAPVSHWGQGKVDVIESVDDGVHIDEPEEAHESSKFRLAEITKHDEHASTKWIIHGTSVYDITDFIECHPGGKVILRACGGSIDPFWKLFSIHQKPEVRQVLDEFYIGDVDERDLDADGRIDWSILGERANAIDDPFKDDPERCSDLIVQTAKPCNAETPGKLLGDFLTPIRLFFVRNHLWVPRIEETEHKVEIELSDGEEMSYTIEDLKHKFQQHTITVTLQCAGNRRSHMNTAGNGKTSGIGWDIGAIGTAEFTGVRLRDVLLDAGYNVQKACEACPKNPENDRHIHFVAPSDTYEQSIPLHSALNPTSDVLLAWEMNGQSMPRDHGGPLRAIVPGNVATRSVKWVGKVRISCEESMSNWHNRDYKCFGPNVRAADLSPQDWEQAQSIQEMPVQSAITNVLRPEATQPVSVQGFAYSGGGRRIVRVDVSADGGKSWRQASLREDDAKGTKRWAWTLWNIDWPHDQVPSNAEFVVKAVDESHNSQPQTFEGTWNFRGLLGNAWHRVPLAAQAEA